MAEINTEGLEELSYAFMRQEERATATVEEMLQAEAEVYTQHLQDAAAGYGIRKTGGFINSIKAGKTQHEGAAAYKIIAPEGRANHTADYGNGKSQTGNVRYATIGFIYEYGTSSIQPRPWLTKGNQTAEEPAYEKAREIWERYVDSSFNG